MALTGCLLWLLYPGLIDSRVPAFRDAYHFYYPQAVWLEQAAQQGSFFPSWNPSEGLGVSVAGQPSAALYYPLRCLWWLPWLSVAQKFSLVILVHLLIAAAGMKWAARQLGCTDSTAWLAAVSFSLSCPVLFQHTNLIYLCSAAWIGFALAATLAALQSISRREYIYSCIVFAGAASLMLLAGDPQGVANAFIVSSVIFATEFVQRGLHARSATRAAEPVQRAPLTAAAKSEPIGKQLLWCLGAMGLVVVLTCVQWLPAWRWAGHSGRVNASAGRDARVVQTSAAHTPSPIPAQSHASSELSAEFAGAAVSRAASDASTHPSVASAARVTSGESLPIAITSPTPTVDAVLRATRPGPPHRYDFSLSPWHALTCLWPTLGGHYLPHNSRLFAVLPAEGRMWIPSLYFGCWPCLLLLLAVLRARDTMARSLKIVLLVAVLAALGNYSIVWLLRESLSSLGLSSLSAQLPKDHVSSLTWLFNSLVPGYSMFRYPAKWTVWIVAAGSLLAARQLGDPTSVERIVPRRLLLSVLALSLIGMVLSGCLALASGLGYSANTPFSTWFDTWLAANAGDAWLGPPHAQAIAGSLLIAFAVPSLLLGLVAIRNWERLRLPAGSLKELGSKGRNLIRSDSQAKSLGHGESQAKSLRPGESQARSLRHRKTSLVLITLLEMTLCASCWVDFLPAPSLDGNSLNAITSSRSTRALHAPFVWSNLSRVDLRRDHFVRSPQSYAVDQASYQQVWLLGKLGLLADVSSLHAAQSVDPRELAQLRGWLSQHDQLLPQQPEVDRLLRELGVTHRLTRSERANEPNIAQPTARSTQFTWQAIENSLPLCQLLVRPVAQLEIDAGTDAEAVESLALAVTPSWRWTHPDQLVVQIPAAAIDRSAEGVSIHENTAPERRATTVDTSQMLHRLLIVRQTNDGGWLAHDASGRELEIRHEPFFIEVELPHAAEKIQLSRKWFW